MADPKVRSYILDYLIHVFRHDAGIVLPTRRFVFHNSTKFVKEAAS